MLSVRLAFSTFTVLYGTLTRLFGSRGQCDTLICASIFVNLASVVLFEAFCFSTASDLLILVYAFRQDTTAMRE